MFTSVQISNFLTKFSQNFRERKSNRYRENLWLKNKKNININTTKRIELVEKNPSNFLIHFENSLIKRLIKF